MRRAEKITVLINNKEIHYTGFLEPLPDDWILISTTRNETLIFRKEQIIQRRAI